MQPDRSKRKRYNFYLLLYVTLRLGFYTIIIIPPWYDLIVRSKIEGGEQT